MNEDRIEEIKNALREMMQLVVIKGKPISDEEKIMLTRAMEYASQRITQLRQEQAEQEQLQQAEAEQAEVAEQISPPQQPPTPPIGGEIPELDPAPHESSNINAFKYDPKSKKLIVKFQGKFPSQNGPVYSYEGVPQNIFNVFRRGAVVPRTSGRNAWHRWQKGIAPSHGASMYALIREGGFPYQRLR